MIVLAIHGFYAPGAAWASCSHRAGSSSAPILNLYHFDSLILAATSFLPEDGLAPSPGKQSAPGPRGPCSGLSCSSRFPLPVSTTFQSRDRPDQWGTLGMLVVLDISSPPLRTIDEPTPHSVGQVSCIFHPPRV